MDPVSIVTTILSLIPDLLSTRGGRLIAGRYIAGKYFSSVALNKINPIAGARYKRVLKNPWLQFLKKIRTFIRNEYKVTLPPKERFKIASDLYRRLKASGQLDNVLRHHKLPLEVVEVLEANLVIRPKYDRKKLLTVPFATPATPLETTGTLTTPSAVAPPGPTPTITLPPEVHVGYEAPQEFFPPELSPEAEARKQAVYQRIHEHAIPSMAVTFVPPYFPPPSESEKQQLQEVQKNAAQETIAETVQKTLDNVPKETSPETKAEIIKENIQNVQQQLAAEGNLEALSPEVVKEAAKDAGIVQPSKDKEAIAEAVSEIIGELKEDIKAEIKEKEQLAESVSGLTTPAEEEEKKRFLKVLKEKRKGKEKERELVASGYRRKASRRK